jgi:uncharacterized protein YgiM (DUF1202 family)
MKIPIFLLIFVIIILLSGCFQGIGNNEHNVSKSSTEATAKETTVVGSNQEAMETYPLNQLKDTDIEWITKKGGLPSDKNWVVLYPEKDDDKIVKIINLIKSCSNMHKSTKEDLDFMNTKHGYPVDVVIRMKDGSQFSLISAMKLTSRKIANGTEITGITYKDHFLLAYEKDNKTEYYTLYSHDAAAYVLDPSNPDFPRVDNFVITPENFNYGDKISISGGGCTENEVNIILSNGNDADKEEYIIGKVKPVYGEWNWNGSINKYIKTYEGKDIFLKNEKFFVGLQIGGSRYTSGRPIVFKDYLFAKDKIVGDWKETVVVNNCSVKNGPSKDYRNIGNLKYGDTVLLFGSFNGWFLAKSDMFDEFWIEGKNVINYDYNKNGAFGVVTAEKVTLGNISLNKGNLVWILKRDSERSYVIPVAIDVNSGYSGWIRNSEYTTDKKGIYFNQAFLKKGAKVYNEASEESEIDKDFAYLSGQYIFINTVQADGWMGISALGGINGWVKDTDVYLP